MNILEARDRGKKAHKRPKCHKGYKPHLFQRWEEGREMGGAKKGPSEIWGRFSTRTTLKNRRKVGLGPNRTCLFKITERKSSVVVHANTHLSNKLHVARQSAVAVCWVTWREELWMLSPGNNSDCCTPSQTEIRDAGQITRQ